MLESQEKLVSTPVLAIPNGRGKYTPDDDAYNVYLGCALPQEQPNGTAEQAVETVDQANADFTVDNNRLIFRIALVARVVHLFVPQDMMRCFMYHSYHPVMAGQSGK